MEDLETPTSFLGIKTGWHDGAAYLPRKAFIQKLLLKTQMLEPKPMMTTMIKKPESSRTDSVSLDGEEALKFRSIVGSFMCIANKTRPDISVAASTLGIGVENTCQYDMIAAKPFSGT